LGAFIIPVALLPKGVKSWERVKQHWQPESGARHLKNYWKTLTITACLRQAERHRIEHEYLVALTVEAAALACLPLAGTHWIPGVAIL